MSAPSWEIIAGRCGACLRFERDFGAGEGKAYGHCPPKPRRGSISSADSKCDAYDPVEAVAPARSEAPRTHSRSNPFDVTVETPYRGPEPTRAKRRQHAPAVVLRRQTREQKDAEPIEWMSEDAPENKAVSESITNEAVSESITNEAVSESITNEAVSESITNEPAPSMREKTMDRGTLRQLIREAIEDSLGIGEAELVDRFKGGTVVVHPGREGTQPKEIPIDGLMRKIIMVRDNLRVLEQKVNNHPKLDDADRIGLQQYITRCYGSLTTFNMLFKQRDDQFRGSGKR